VNEKKRPPFAERLRIGLHEALAHARGEITLKTIVHPSPPPEIDPATLVALRTEAGMSQGVFAKLLSTSTKTVQSWEQGTRVPSMAARRLIQVFIFQPAALCDVVGLPRLELQGFEVRNKPSGNSYIVFHSKAINRKTRKVSV
jgi:putative transcriptional regulator